MNHQRVAVAIPAYQAAPWIGSVIEQVEEVGLPVLVVDDGSSDNTAALARSAGAEVERLSENRGKGAALRVAFERLFDEGSEAVVTLDADGQHLPSEIPQLVEGWRSGGDLILGTRERLWDQMSRLRGASNRLSSQFISWLAATSLPDVQTGFRLYRRELIEAVGFPGDRFEAESAVVVRTARYGYRIIGVPVEHQQVDGRSSSHYRPVIDSFRIAVAVARARLERR